MQHNANWFAAAYLHATSPSILTFDETHLAQAQQAIHALGFTADVNLTVHKSDVMYLFALLNHVHSPSQALNSYYNTGAVAAQKIQGICNKYNLRPGSFLDFGTGYGRTLRFLKEAFPQATFSATEIKKEAIHFVEKQFDVKGYHHSSEVPKELPWPKQDFILAQSVFTHLPKPLFEAWLRLLYNSLNAGGALLFTYKSRALNKQHLGRIKHLFYPKDFVYLQSSEDVHFPFLANQNKVKDYGVSYVSKSYLHKQAQALGGELHLLGRAISDSQSVALLLKQD